MKKLTTTLLAATFAFGLTSCGAPETPKTSSEAKQLIIVKSIYRVTNVDTQNFRVGIALQDADPYVRQNWLKLKIQTNVLQRVYGANGAVYERKLAPQTFLQTIQPGQLIRVEGGRDWDGTVVAKHIWF